MAERRLRLVRPEDVPAIWELAERQNERLGTSTPVPRLFDENDRLLANVALALKTEEDGRLVRADIFERQVELVSFGLDAGAVRFGLRALDWALAELVQQGYQGLHAMVGRERAAAFERGLGQRLKMKRDDTRLAHFYRDFGGEE